MSRFIFGVMLGSLILLTLTARSPAWAQEEEDFPRTLHTILKQGDYDAMVGDLVQVRYRTRAIEDGIRTLEVQLDGRSLTRVALVTSALDPTQELQPGAEYYIIAMFKAARVGRTKITVTPLHNNDTRGRPFRFTVNVEE